MTNINIFGVIENKFCYKNSFTYLFYMKLTKA